MIRCYFVLLSSNKDFTYLFTRRLLSLSWNTLFCFLSWYALLQHCNNYSPWGKDTWAPSLWLIIKRCHIHRVVVGLSEQTLCLFAKRYCCGFFLVLFFRPFCFFTFRFLAFWPTHCLLVDKVWNQLLVRVVFKWQSIAIARLCGWLENLAPVIQPMRSETNHTSVKSVHVIDITI